MRPLRIVFFGSAELACVSLKALVNRDDFLVELVVTQPDRPKGRHLKLEPPPLKKLALSLGLRIDQPEKSSDPGFVAELRGIKPDLIIVTAYGQILKRELLEIPPHGCINVHASLLPKYRGAAPIQWALINGEQETGVTIMKMDEGMDTGDILASKKTTIQASDDASILHDRLATLGADLLVETLPTYLSGKIFAKKQASEGVSYARKIKKQDGCLSWSDSAKSINNKIRALNPWPGAFSCFSDWKMNPMIKLLKAEVVETQNDTHGEIYAIERDGIVVACGHDSLRILALQRAGGKRLSAREFLHGHDLRVGQRFQKCSPSSSDK
jgi:methionyl-tRNA formyltransferase